MNILDPQGPVGAAEKTILIDSLAIMLAIVLPTILATFAFAFWFRESNRRATYRPDFDYSPRAELVMWSIPTLTILLLSGVIWLGSHQLDPRVPLDAQKHLKVQVVSLDWRWLFIYPEQKVASLNSLTVPAGAELQFELTSAGVMNAFFVPQLGSMIYAMNGMRSRLNLRADNVGTYRGLSTQFSGDGFAGMDFAVHVVDDAAFAEWTQKAEAAPDALDAARYAELAVPSANHDTMLYRLADPHLFDAIVTQKLPPAPGPPPSPRPKSQASAQSASPAGLADVR